MRRLRSLIAAVLLATASPASANFFDSFGAGPRSQAMAGATTATVSDYTAAFVNPAGLPNSKNTLAFGVTGAFNRSSILLMRRPSGYNPPAYDLRINPRADTEHTQGAIGFTLGFSVKLFSEDFALGGMFFAPTDGFANTDSWFGDEREQFFSNALHAELMGDRIRNEVFSFGLGYRFRPWLSMGIGFLVLPTVKTVTHVYTPNAAEPGEVELNIKLEQGARRALNAGLLLSPTDWLRVGLTFQDALFFQIGGYSDVQLVGEEADEPPRQVVDLVGNYSPARVSSSVAAVGDWGNVTLETVFNAWSGYLDNHGELAGFEDTVDFKLGLELPFGAAKARFGLSWLPSPVPTQDGRTNYVDTDRLGIGFGGGRDFEFFGQDITLDFSMQVQALCRRETRKAQLVGGYPDCEPGQTRLCDEVPDIEVDTPLVNARDTKGLQTGNPGFPGFSYGGYLVASGFDLKWRF